MNQCFQLWILSSPLLFKICLTAHSVVLPPSLTLQAEWSDMVWPATEGARHDPETGVYRNVLERVGIASIDVPEGFVSFVPWAIDIQGWCWICNGRRNSKLQRHIKNWLQSIKSGKGIDFSTAEVGSCLYLYGWCPFIWVVHSGTWRCSKVFISVFPESWSWRIVSDVLFFYH